MKSKIFLILLIIALIVQFGVGLNIVRKHTAILDEGVALKFKCRPLDPYDIFRGRYVQLNMAPVEAEYARPIPQVELRLTEVSDGYFPLYFGDGVYKRTKYFVELEADENGFAKVKAYAPENEFDSDTVMEMNLERYDELDQYKADKLRFVYFQPPFDKFFMNEKDAPAAETAMLGFNNRTLAREIDDTYLLVKFKNGKHTVADLIINGKPAKEFASEVIAEEQEKIRARKEEAKAAEAEKEAQ